MTRSLGFCLMMLIALGCQTPHPQKEMSMTHQPDNKIKYDGPEKNKAAALEFIDASLKKNGNLGGSIGDLSAGLAQLAKEANIQIQDQEKVYAVGVYAQEYELTFNVDKKSQALSNVVLASIAQDDADYESPDLKLSPEEINAIPVLKKFMENRSPLDHVTIADEGEHYEAIVSHPSQKDQTGGAEQYFINKKTGEVKMGWHEHPMPREEK